MQVFRNHRTLGLEDKEHVLIAFIQGLVVALPLRDNQVALLEAFTKPRLAVLEEGTRRIGAIFDDFHETHQAGHGGVLLCRIVEDGRPFDGKGHVRMPQRLDQQSVENDLAGIIREVQDLPGIVHRLPLKSSGKLIGPWVASAWNDGAFSPINGSLFSLHIGSAPFL
jgi:hypothetical protein